MYLAQNHLRSLAKQINFTRQTLNNIRTMSESCTKIPKLDCYIGTHDGTFHCDDVTACFMLKELDRFKNHQILRTRDESKLADAEIVVDVGSEFDSKRLRLDHHQRSFHKTIKDFYPKMKTTNPDKPVRLSASGLVYALFGKDVLVKLLKLEAAKYEDLDEDGKHMIDKIYERAYLELFEEIDAIDNGVELVTGEDIVYNYHISSHISARVGYLNPTESNASPELRLERFKKAMEMVGAEIRRGVEFLGQQWWPVRQQFKQYFMSRKEFDASGEIILLGADNLVGWKSALYELEEEHDCIGQIKFVIFCDGSVESPWRAVAVPTSSKSFVSRVPLLEEWRGKRNDELQKVSSIADATFVHMTGFTGGAKSLDGIKSMVRKTLALE